MTFSSLGYVVFDVPALSQDDQDTFSDLVLDPYCGGKQRYRRFSQYGLTFERGAWRTDLLPHRPFIQSRIYNKRAGGILRDFRPLKINPTKQIAPVAAALDLDRSERWQINVHQCRVVTDHTIRGVSVPEGPHRDGHELGTIIVFGRHEIRGGETQLMPPGGGPPLFRVELVPCQAIAYDDARFFHTATDIEPTSDGLGYRDLWIVALNRWNHRRYGDAFEEQAMASR